MVQVMSKKIHEKYFQKKQSKKPKSNFRKPKKLFFRL